MYYDSRSGPIEINKDEYVALIHPGTNGARKVIKTWGFRFFTTVECCASKPFYEQESLTGMNFIVPSRDRGLLRGPMKVVALESADYILLDAEKITDSPRLKPIKEPVVEVEPADEMTKPRKEKVPRIIRDHVWAHYMGNVFRARCYCCGYTEIKATAFECGHVISVANGGETTISNLRPICSSCNRSMGTTNLEEYKRRITVAQK